MKILVTGATSGLGRNATEILLRDGHQVVACGRDLVIGQELTDAGAVFIPVELAQLTPETAHELMAGCQAVWHCAALSAPWGARETFEAINWQATKTLAQTAAKEGIERFVHISTPAIYFNFTHQNNIRESTTNTQFANDYARTKFLAEQEIAKLVPDSPLTTFVILRPRGLFGAYDRVLLPRLMAQVRARHGKLVLPAGGKNAFDLTYVDNVVHAMLLATEKPLKSGSIFNITNHEPLPLATTLQALFAQTGTSCQIKSAPYPLLYAVALGLEKWAMIQKKEPLLTRYSLGAAYFTMILNNERAQNELGYTPRYSMAEGIARTAQWLQENQEGVQ
ncbi:NAD-dependent epimerase/dehydratase family protein [Providencia alcalifaciens]|uniref:3-beta hydroxysteroid dehydrogenase/isomerase family protein n=1 Tax=Providencia alcalifaciens 205/92 TaxID=1256988 RepID=A0AAV3M245_9GAMM|nr:NAD-dependent epimerase/dehydratase family protein [Providencia alcalifaciens]EUC97037.1 3-beta hydroxysteroid dehydrogenase/isomerase family protein [Providencia alcalifaciens PAL-2]EUD09818.1 3-beta hydroxysteroid dehydrogenase/isomerase family protein [Providencia alcalifaciens 205/92]MBF0691562.1 NAD-dependent epimerase/dehydratase family protein [Providencia alcalifaciens]MTB31829.1 NAD-dependent epimerase/dehydratase family protein [Providencia alcalifaciens]MTC15855.1 NAD-dependent e